MTPLGKKLSDRYVLFRLTYDRFPKTFFDKFSLFDIQLVNPLVRIQFNRSSKSEGYLVFLEL